MKLNIYQVDAFADRLFAGNPAAVCPLNSWLPDETMQQIAMENNLSETAFFISKGEKHELRWFTPAAEVDLCGHATLATAHVIFKHLSFEGAQLTFATRSGDLTVQESGDGWYTMNFPAKKLTFAAPPEKLREALGGVEFQACLKSDDYLIRVKNANKLKSLKPDFRTLSTIDCRGVIATAPGEDTDFVSRFFAPAVGVDEDPVTGSAHTMLTPYWARELDKRELTARQLSERGGFLKCRLTDDERVQISGQAKTFLTGTISI